MNLLNTFLQTEALSHTSEGIAGKIQGFLNNFGLTDSATSIIGGIVVLIAGFFIAKLVAGIIGKLIRKTGIDNKMKGKVKISKFIGKLVYFILMIIVLMTALNIMGVGDEVLAPLNEMVTKFLGAIPAIITAGIIIYAGYFLAKILSESVNFLGDTLTKYAPKLNLPEDIDLLKIIKNIVFIIVFIPVLIVGLNFLNFTPITKPATGMLEDFMSAIPKIIQASAILFVFIFGGRLIVGLLKELLDSLKVNNLSEKLGLQNVFGDTSLSSLLSNLALFFIIFSGIMQALAILELTQISAMLENILAIAAKVVFGLVILALGNVVANFVVKLFSSGENSNKFTGTIMKGAVMVIFLAMGLNAMDIADEIINLAFGLGLGAVAVAFALSFGLGGKEAAGREMEKFFNKFKDNK